MKFTVFAEGISLLERAYVFFNKTDPAPGRAHQQWPGWCGYALDFVDRPQFCEVWKKLKRGFDADFVKWMDDDLRACTDQVNKSACK